MLLASVSLMSPWISINPRASFGFSPPFFLSLVLQNVLLQSLGWTSGQGHGLPWLPGLKYGSIHPAVCTSFPLSWVAQETGGTWWNCADVPNPILGLRGVPQRPPGGALAGSGGLSELGSGCYSVCFWVDHLDSLATFFFICKWHGWTM